MLSLKKLQGNKNVGSMLLALNITFMLSLIVTTLWNPFYLVMLVTTMPLVGDVGTMIFLSVGMIWILKYSFDYKAFKNITMNKWMVAMFSMSAYMIIISIMYASIYGGMFKIILPSEAYSNLFWSGYVYRFDASLVNQAALTLTTFNIGALGATIWYFGTFGMLGSFASIIASISWMGLLLFLHFSNTDFIEKFKNKKIRQSNPKKIGAIDINELKTKEFNFNKTELSDKARHEENEVLKKLNQNPKKQAAAIKTLNTMEERKEIPLVDPAITKSRLREQQRLNDLRDKILSSKPDFDKSNERKEVYASEQIKTNKQRKLLDMGFISPVSGDVRNKSDETKLQDDFLEEWVKEPTAEIEVPNVSKLEDILFAEKAIDEALELTTEHVSPLEPQISKVVVEDIDNLKKFIDQNHTQEIPAVLTTKEINELGTDIFAPKAEVTSDEATSSQTFEEIIAEDNSEVIVHENEDDLGTNDRPKNWCAGFKLPTSDILSDKQSTVDINSQTLEAEAKSEQINELFSNFNIGALVVGYKIGPTVTTYEIEVEPGTKVSKITSIEDNIKLTLEAKDIRIQAPIPGKSLVGIEVPNTQKKLVTFKEAFDASTKSGELPIVLGQDVFGAPFEFDLTKAPHLLVAGSTGSGKSVAINTILSSLIMTKTPRQVKLLLIDPKMVEFITYQNVPHLVSPVITSPSDANIALQQIVETMESRYKLMASEASRNILELNSKLRDRKEEELPYIVVVIDELADLMMVASKDVESSIMRITQKARAAGIHMIVATQRPSTDIITGVIKSNIPSRISFTVASSIDSRTILDKTGAEKLVGMGDMLVSLYGQIPIRGQGAYISEKEISDMTRYAKDICEPHYEIEIKEEMISTDFNMLIDLNDPLYLAAKELVIKQQKASTSLIQRYLKVGYNKAATIIDTLENEGVIGPSNGSKPRTIIN